MSDFTYPYYFDDENTYKENFTKTLNNTFSPIHRSIQDEILHLLTIQLEDPTIDINLRNKNYESPLLSSLRIHNKEMSVEMAMRILQVPEVDVNLPDYQGDTPLHEIVKNHSNIELLTQILQNQRCNVNVRNFLGETPLHLSNSEAYVEKLIEHGANVNGKDNSNNTSLHTHVSNSKICEILIKNGATLNVANVNGVTPLHKATEQNNAESVILLLNNGANCNLESDYKERLTPLQLAFRNRACDRIKEQLWLRSRPIYLIFAANYDSTKIPNVLENWSLFANSEDEIVDFFSNLIQTFTNCKHLKYVICGRLVAQYFLDHIDKLSLENRQKCIKKFSQCLNKRSLLNFLLKTHDYSSSNSLKEIESIIEKLLDCGEILDYSDLEVIYLQFGNCYLLHKLIKSPVSANTRSLRDIPLFLRILWDVSTNVTETINSKIISNINVLDFFDIHNLARYVTLPTKLYLNFYHSYKHIIRFQKPELQSKMMEDCMRNIETNSGIVSLLELSRNLVRPTLCRKYKVSKAHELYRVLVEMGLPPLIISLIMMEMPIYYNVTAPDYRPFTKHLYLL